MSTRLSVDLIFLSFIAAIVGWACRAPADPHARAAYLCAPIALVGATAAHLEAAMADNGSVAPPEPPWRFNPGRSCRRVVAQVAEDLGP